MRPPRTRPLDTRDGAAGWVGRAEGTRVRPRCQRGAHICRAVREGSLPTGSSRTPTLAATVRRPPSVDPNEPSPTSRLQMNLARSISNRGEARGRQLASASVHRCSEGRAVAGLSAAIPLTGGLGGRLRPPGGGGVLQPSLGDSRIEEVAVPRVDDALAGARDPLLAFRSIAILPATGEAEFVLTDGRMARTKGIPLAPTSSTVKTSFFPERSEVELLLHDGKVIVLDVGTVFTSIDRPVIYLDQNHWIDLARAVVGSSKLSAARAQACGDLIELARTRRVILPISAGHLVETVKTTGQRRANLGRTMLELSRGWQMRSPLRIRALELLRLFSCADAIDGPITDVFTLAPHSIWSQPKDLHSGHFAPFVTLDGLVERLSWSMTLVELLLEDEREVSEEGANIARNWAASFQDLGQYVPSNPKAKARIRDLSRIRFISDMQGDVAKAASLSGLTPEQFSAWLAGDSEEAFRRASALGRMREVIHVRLSNSDDRWEANDLNDLLYLATAAGYADVVVCERKTANLLNQVSPRVPQGAAVFRRLEDGLAHVHSVLAD